MMRKALLVAAAVPVAVIFFLLATLPPRPLAVAPAVDPGLQARTVAGAYHVHSTRSDGAGDVEAIAAAAARAGLRFVILTDHGDGTRPPDPPAYRHGVLCLDGVEISTNGGHYVALDMRPSPYPLGGEPAAVVEDVRRLGGFGIAAHPDSPRAALAWRDWTAPVDGIEWLSADTEWRNESRAGLARVLFDYAWRPGPALASILDRPAATLERWDAIARSRPVVGIAGHDAHGGIGRGREEGATRLSEPWNIPSYEASFRSFSTRAILERPLSGDAAADARQLMTAIRSGRIFTVIDALASPGFIDYRLDGASPVMGSTVGARSPAVVSIAAAMPPGARMVLIGNGREVQQTTAGTMFAEVGDGSFRVEVRLPRGTPSVPWLTANPVYGGPRETPPEASAAPPAAVDEPVRLDWHVEKDAASTASVSREGEGIMLAYALRPGARASQFAAAVADLRGRTPAFTRLTFSVRAARPARLSVQLRYPQGGGVRWGSSVYVDDVAREHQIALDGLKPMDHQGGEPPPSPAADSLLFVVDLTNARPGDANTIMIGAVRFGQ